MDALILKKKATNYKKIIMWELVTDSIVKGKAEFSVQ